MMQWDECRGYINQMSQSRLNKSHSRAKSYLQQSIEYRKVFHKRNNHHSPASPPPRVPSQTRPTESRLERLINLEHGQGRSHLRNLSLSSSQNGSRDYRTPLNYQPSPSSLSHSKNESYSALQRQQQMTPSSRNQPATPKQKLSLKQQKAPPISSQIGSTPTPTSLPTSIEQITDRMNQLVNKKLKIVMDSLHNKKEYSQEKKREVNAQLQSLMGLMRQAQGLKGGDMHLLNQKIAFIETMMAEQTAEAEIMKKHYYHLSSSKIKGKVGDFTHHRAKVADAYQSLSHHPAKARLSLPKEDLKKPLFKETTNKSSYKQPKTSDYESYRYRHKLTPMNPQPLPRSSYKRDFLVLKSQPDQKIVNRDHSPYYPASKARVGSTYGQDYRKLKTETIDHRELDAFRDKIRTIKVSYMPQKRPEADMEDRTAYREAVSMSRVKSNISQSRAEEPPSHKRMLLSESRRQFQGEVAYQPSRIKHQQLQSFQYKLKHLFKL